MDPKVDPAQQQALINALMGSWPARMGHSIYDAMKLPGDVYQGNTTVTGEDGRSNPEVINRATDLAGLVMGGSYAAPAARDATGMGIRAYHGSPHDFDKFDLSKIGTGEGAQAYGHGLYFAENEGVARAYRDQLSGSGVMSSGKIIETNNGKIDITKAANPADKLAYQAFMEGINVGWNKVHSLVDGWTRGDDALRKSVMSKVNELDMAGAKVNPGRMYEVNINAHPDQFLDWDRALSGQSEKVKYVSDAYRIPQQSEYKLYGEKPIENTGSQLWDVVSGRGLSGRVPETGMQLGEAGANTLREHGIPGIKYLDQGSRGAGEGTRNYVVFDPSLIEILRKYGIGAAPGAAAMADQLMNPQGASQ